MRHPDLGVQGHRSTLLERTAALEARLSLCRTVGDVWAVTEALDAIDAALEARRGDDMTFEDDFNEWAEVAPGKWAPAIPLPLMGVRKRCYCGRPFWTMPGYRGHYALVHILERDANFRTVPRTETT